MRYLEYPRVDPIYQRCDLCGRLVRQFTITSDKEGKVTTTCLLGRCR